MAMGNHLSVAGALGFFDDSPKIREVLAEMLERQGAAVTAGGPAEHAPDVLQRRRPDVLLSDLEVPEKDGLWLTGQVRALAPSNWTQVQSARGTTAIGVSA